MPTHVRKYIVQRNIFSIFWNLYLYLLFGGSDKTNDSG